MYEPYVCGGSYDSEVSWTLAGLSGGADDSCVGSSGSFEVSEFQVKTTEWCKDPVSAEVAYGHISTWDTSDVTDMSSFMSFCSSARRFNDDISQVRKSGRGDMHDDDGC